jgi:hypothetical protein
LKKAPKHSKMIRIKDVMKAVNTGTEAEKKKQKTTQGHVKMLRYLDDLVRSKDFQKAIKKLRRLEKKVEIPSGKYSEWTPEQQRKHDGINAELTSIIDGYELLRKRCFRVMADRYSLYRHKIAFDFGLDGYAQNFAKALVEKNPATIKFWEEFLGDALDMCMATMIYEDAMTPINKGDEIIYLSPQRQLNLIAYPVAISVHSKAAKADVLDYVEKKWPWIESLLRSSEEKPLKVRKRKHSQEVLDFIWEHRSEPAKEIKIKLDIKFPHNGIVYFEIHKIISLEKVRRLGKLS